jgi:hypothetical protein
MEIFSSFISVTEMFHEGAQIWFAWQLDRKQIFKIGIVAKTGDSTPNTCM